MNGPMFWRPGVGRELRAILDNPGNERGTGIRLQDPTTAGFPTSTQHQK
jgi:hypothetical protein